MKYEIRPFAASDVNFVFDTWLNSWRVSKYAGVVRNCSYYTETRSLIEDLLARGMKVAVADAGSTLLGFVAYEVKDGEAVVHYLWVKSPYLNLPIADRLLDAIPARRPGMFTFHNRRLEKAGWKHVPEIARRQTL